MPRSLLIAFAALVPTLLAQSPPAAEANFACEGRVVDLRGDGVPVASVRVFAVDAPDAVLVKSTTDGDGYFRLGKVPQRTGLQLEARAEGRCPTRTSVTATSGALLLRLQDAVVVRGILQNRKGEPVANTPVRASLEGRILFDAGCDGRTDAEGRFELPTVPLGPCRIGAWIDGEGVAEQLLHVHAELSVTLTPTDEKRADLVVTIEGLPEGPMEPISLALLPYTNRLAYLPPPYDRPRIANGSWRGEGLPDRDYTIYPSSTRFAFAPRQVQLAAGKGPHQVKFTAAALGSASLLCKAIVRGPDDKPVAGLPFVMRPSNSLNAAEATSGEDGTLQFASPLAAGSKVVVYTTDPAWVVDQKKDEQNGMLDRRSLKQHETTVEPASVLELRVIRACSIAGRLLLADGRPAPFVRVELQESRSGRWPQWMGMAWATTQRDGTFRFAGLHHLDDALRLHVASAAGSATGEPLQVAAPGTALVVGDVKLAAPALVEGVVRDAEQRPVGGLRVWLRDWDFTKGGQQSGSVVETLTDRHGRYRFVGVPPGGAWLQLLTRIDERLTSDRAVEPFEVEVGKTYTFDLQVPAK